MKTKKEVFLIDYDLEFKNIVELVSSVLSLEPKSVVTLLVDTEGGSVPAAELLSSLFVNALKDGRILRLDIILGDTCSSSAIDFVFNLREVANVYVGSVMDCIVHKLSYEDKATDEGVIAAQKRNIERDTKVTLLKYSKFLDRRQIATYKKGADITISHEQIINLFNAKHITEWH